MGTKDIDFLKYFPFLSNSVQVTSQLNMTVEKIEETNIYNNILLEIYKELSLLLNPELASKIKFYPVTHYSFEVAKFYLTILVLRLLDNIAVTRIWVRYFSNKINFHIKELVDNPSNNPVKLFLDLFRLLETDNHFQLKKITLDQETKTFGLPMLTYLDVAAQVSNSDGERYQPLKLVNVTLHNGFVIIGYHETDFLSSFIEYFAKLKIFQLYNTNADFIIPSKKIERVVKQLKDLILLSEKTSINIKKHHVPKEILYEQEKIKDVERSNIIINDIMNNKQVNGSDKSFGSIPTFPPCVNVLLDKIISKKRALSHNENILLCTYLAKKHFIKDHIIKIFSLAVNYDPKTTSYQVSSLVDKDLMPMNCSNLETEGICKKELDKTNQCGSIKNPLSFR